MLRAATDSRIVCAQYCTHKMSSLTMLRMLSWLAKLVQQKNCDIVKQNFHHQIKIPFCVWKILAQHKQPTTTDKMFAHNYLAMKPWKRRSNNGWQNFAQNASLCVLQWCVHLCWRQRMAEAEHTCQNFKVSNFCAKLGLWKAEHFIFCPMTREGPSQACNIGTHLYTHTPSHTCISCYECMSTSHKYPPMYTYSNTHPHAQKTPTQAHQNTHSGTDKHRHTPTQMHTHTVTKAHKHTAPWIYTTLLRLHSFCAVLFKFCFNTLGRKSGCRMCQTEKGIWIIPAKSVSVWTRWHITDNRKIVFSELPARGEFHK